MKFFLISNMYPTKTSPGYGSFVKNVCEGLSDFGVEAVHKAIIRGRSSGKLNKIWKYLFFYLSIIINFFKKYDFIYIHFPNQAIPLLRFLYRLKKPKIVINYHGEDLVYERSGYALKLGKMTESFCRQFATKVVVPSEYFKSIVISRDIMFENDIIVSPSGGINKDYFFPNSKTLNLTPLHIGYVGRLEPDKGIYEFLEVCKQLKEKLSFKATIIGYGSCFDFTNNFIKANNLSDSVTLINGMPQAKLGDYYRKLNLLVFCSNAKTGESLGLTGIEAMACGVPVIGSNIGGITSYLRHKKNGWLVDVKNVDQIIDSIYEYLQLSDSDKEKMIKSCVLTGEKYYSEKVCNQLANNMKSIIYTTPLNKVILLNDNHLGALLHFRKEVITSLAKSGYTVILVAPVAQKTNFNLPTGVHFIPISMNRTSRSVIESLNYCVRLYRIIKKTHPDIVINYTIKPIIFGSIVCHCRRVRSVAFFAGLSTYISKLSQNKTIFSYLSLKIFKHILNWNYKAIFLNESDINFMKNNSLLKEDKYILFAGGEGVDVDSYKPVLCKNKSFFKVVMVSRVLKSKGYEEFVKAAEMINKSRYNIKLFLVGGIDETHPDRVSLSQITKDSSNGVFQYLGHLNNLPEFLKDTDCVVLPSYYNEGMNRSLMEALSMGIPIITTTNRGCKELVIDGKTGFLIPPKDSEALYNALVKLYNLPEDEKELLSKRSALYARQRFDVKEVIKEYLKLITS